MIVDECKSAITTVTVVGDAFTGLIHITMIFGVIVVLLIALIFYSWLKGRYYR
ncbi:hypothetical protein DKAM_1145 [Desulfurococcus amylolyticus 1221n]|uniref:Uncharacterized protein n=1 Tax=Desulfurococcus amylolyticus (strain DSM 18924 / JCM 16383 / VKM B-2413 / 1221n) TaxID=490899 RepID=B8D5U0_DESA1|nr:hypothetical protein [Desulfurococcus amylolyticus]ACL11471.1 hypothetical protein DKAM_1145 [Desulfurococcus amylolyticus 1221n]